MDEAIHTDRECGICYEEYGDGAHKHEAVALRCGHVFGSSCAEAWIVERHTCPFCKTAAKTSQLIRIFNAPRLPRPEPSKDELTIVRLRRKLLLRKRKIRLLNGIIDRQADQICDQRRLHDTRALEKDVQHREECDRLKKSKMRLKKRIQALEESNEELRCLQYVHLKQIFKLTGKKRFASREHCARND